MKNKSSIAELFANAKANDTYVNVCAPMVRYSKVQFRTLVKNYGVDLCFTPMVLADSFCQNAKARASEFSTTVSDSPVVVQFAANNVNDFVDASKLIYPYADGVDLNCGCPQRWAMKDGYGCALLSKPEMIQELVKGVRSALPNSFSVSVKVRILKDLKQTIDMCKQLEKCGVNFLTVHGRTPEQKSSGNVDYVRLKDVCDNTGIPIIANGGVKSLEDADELYNAVGCDGVMAASGLLTNPALFSGINRTPHSCIKMWMQLKNIDSYRITFQCYHHHLVFMLDKILTKQQKQVFNILSTFESVDAYLYKYVLDSDESDVQFKYNMGEFVNCEFPDEITLKHCTKCRGCGKSVHYCICIKYDCEASDGTFFKSYVKGSDALDYMDSNIFDEPC
ncbi:tRNA-dihydrouridine(20a/20b) synthase [NAD(P)+]-like [Pectinophora gossypiella]|uniref:tRNA-dihydrouridine(20a/20b) synthase [NAD(P)+]-like n=1 Tax=Pectinophora gossypiella TaxID=13191 RepID=UPI00214EF475|nr:tRNA-dihydrouridine(20a/20b) synthase [NAD(P)+]-like [Pectinophora gossypiella]